MRCSQHHRIPRSHYLIQAANRPFRLSAKRNFVLSSAAATPGRNQLSVSWERKLRSQEDTSISANLPLDILLTHAWHAVACGNCERTLAGCRVTADRV